MVINTAKIPPSKVAPCTRFVEITSWRTTVKSPACLWVRTKSLVRAQALPPGQYCRRRLPMKPRWSAPIARLRFLWNMRSRAHGRAPSEVASLAAPGTRAAGPSGRPWRSGGTMEPCFALRDKRSKRLSWLWVPTWHSLPTCSAPQRVRTTILEFWNSNAADHERAG